MLPPPVQLMLGIILGIPRITLIILLVLYAVDYTRHYVGTYYAGAAGSNARAGHFSGYAGNSAAGN